MKGQLHSLAVVLFFFTATALMGCASQEPIVRATPMGGTDWSTHNHDPSRSSATDTQLELPLVPSWERNTSTDRFTAPAIVDGVVYTGSTSDFFALKADSGFAKWRIETGAPVYAPPTVTAGRVYFGTGEGRLFSVDGESGRTLWTYQALSMINSSPIVTDSAVFFTSADLKLHAVGVETGKRLWTYNHGPYRPVSSLILNSPTISGSVGVSVGVGGDRGAETLLVLFSDGYLVALETELGRVLWSKPVARDLLSSKTKRRTALVVDGSAFIIGSPGSVIELDLKDGSEIRGYRDGEAIDFATSGATLYILYETRVAAFDIATAELLWEGAVDGAARGLFAAGDTLFVLSSFIAVPFKIEALTREIGRVDAFDSVTGDKVWTKVLDKTVSAIGAASGGVIALVTTEGTITVLAVSGPERALGAPEPM